jgi:hypothetical protein
MFDIRDFAASLERAQHLAERAAELQSTQAQVDVRQADLVLEFERLRASGATQFRDTEAFLRNATGLSRATARTRVQAFRQLVVLPTMRSLLTEGAVTFDHVRALAEHADSPNRDAVLDDEAEVAGWASDVSADDYRKRLAVWARDLDDKREADQSSHERQRRRVRVRRTTTSDGLHRTILDLDDEADAIVHAAVRDIVREMQQAEDKAKLPPDQRRSSAQRWGDAFAEMARRSRGADALTKNRARPTILALTEMSVLWDQLRVNGVCELEDGTQLTGAQLRKMACEADIIPIVLSGDGVPLDMGRLARLATWNQRLALRSLHPTCAVEGCNVAFEWCEIHHLKPWNKRGRTDLDNLVPLCSYHHTWVHDLDGNVILELLPDRTLRLPKLPLRPCPRRRSRLIDRLKEPPDLVGARA